MTPYLLDANVLIALVITDHEHHGRATDWLELVDQVALCPIVEGALFRFLIRVGESKATARVILDGLYDSPRCVFWEDSLSYADVALDHVTGHRQVTDAYLASLAHRNGARLATFDQGLAQALPGRVELIGS
ncbi:TA system VapC family ribonuclease toxin [Nocardioides sp. Bht2]|uniref:TA system VapC family ribonuclease toxin n=1 Tax=Nocardioides sp. Bht2 TaxID=3392297 RepID=UPI0039B49FA3